MLFFNRSHKFLVFFVRILFVFQLLRPRFATTCLIYKKKSVCVSVVKTQVGERIGWGVHYDSKLSGQPDFDDKAEQPVLCYVSKNTTIVFAKLMIQPEGGWYPAVALNNHGTDLFLVRLHLNYALHNSFLIKCLSQWHTACKRSKLGFYIPFSSQGHIGTGLQHYYLFELNPHRGDCL